MEEDIKILEDLVKLNKSKITEYKTTGVWYNEDTERYTKYIENLLTRYKQLEEENKELKRKSDRDEILQDISDDFIKAYKRNSIPKSKVKEKIEELKTKPLKINENDKYYYETEVYNKIVIQVLQELLRGGEVI